MTERIDSSDGVRQGDVFWIDVGDPDGSEPGYRRPYVVIQNDVLNRSRIRTAVVCAITSSTRQQMVPGNVLLNVGEANLPQRSVVNVSQIYTVDKTDLDGRIGKLSRRRVQEILDGVHLVLEPRDLTDSE
jgi:mRNA interferase MazF